MDARDRDRFRKLEEAFYAALDLEDDARRESYVTDLRAADPETAQHLEELLSSRRHVMEADDSSIAPLPRFGAWQATKILGRGGMGTVYLAERADGAFQMSAAVKVVP